MYAVVDEDERDIPCIGTEGWYVNGGVPSTLGKSGTTGMFFVDESV